MTLPSRLVVAAVAVASVAFAQSPTSLVADPGPLVPLAGTSLQAPVGWSSSVIFNAAATVGVVETMVAGPTGDLFLAPLTGFPCASTSTNSVFRVPMAGPNPVQPLSVTPVNTQPVMGHNIAVASNGDLYAAGTCAQTSFIYRIGASGTPVVLNSTQPLPDPDSLAVGTPPWSVNEHLFVAVQDALYAADTTLAVPTFFQVNVGLTQTGVAALGNWGTLMFDPNTQTLLGNQVGSPATYRSVEITFQSSTSATAALVAPDGTSPLFVDPTGIRYFSDFDGFGMVDNSGASPVYRPVVTGFGQSVRGTQVSGEFFFIDPMTANVIRFSRSMRTDKLSIPTATTSVINFEIRAGLARASQFYVMAGAFTGATPGSPVNGVVVPLNYDLFTQLLLDVTFVGNPFIPGWLGLLDAQGNSTATLLVPSAPAIMQGVTLHFSYMVGGPPWFASNAVWFHIN